jgi:hypothetical protein
MAAAFGLNRCLWRGCGRVFSNHYALIEHIEEYHIETDSAFLERQELEQPPALPLSYICRFYPPGYGRRRRLSSGGDSSSIRCGKRRSSGESDPFQSDDSEAGTPEYPNERILGGMDSGRPFVCSVPGCRKRYKNVNGLKYHTKHGHPRDSGRVRCGKVYPCHCGKTYKSSTALRHHCLTQHGECPPTPTPGTPTSSTAPTAMYGRMSTPPYILPHQLPTSKTNTSQRTVVNVRVLS